MLELKYFKRKNQQVIKLTKENFNEVYEYVHSIDGMSYVRNGNTIVIPTCPETYTATYGDYIVIWINSYGHKSVGVYYKDEFEKNFEIIE